MPTTLSLTEQTLRCGDFGAPSCVPDILANFNVQNRTQFELDEYEELYEGYGQLQTAYPYRKYTTYTRELTERRVKVAVLENDWLRAVFLPEFGGRLWQLTDQKTGRELLYTNDVLRASNLAVRDAWFSGGVEWNIGVIGHTPLTADPLFTAKTTTGAGEPALRMYAFERIRRVTYQMDFWLGADAPVLNCRIRVKNANKTVTPMYWWSNIAAPEYENGRLFVPAEAAYTHTPGGVKKTAVPLVNGVDISRYCEIPEQVDYFFDIPPERPKFIANVDANGFGLLHTSSGQLRSRKLFSWGKTAGANRWQEFLTDKAGRYIEIQAGLAKTQYGCIPMAPHTAWEWTEQYSPLQLTKEQLAKDFSAVSAELADAVERSGIVLEPKAARSWVKSPSELVWPGSGDARLENAVRKASGLEPLEPHLDFSSEDTAQNEWHVFLETGKLPAPSPETPPAYYVWDDFWMEKLCEAARGTATDNWYVQYHLGLAWWQRGDRERAGAAYAQSLKQRENPWAYHAAAILSLCGGEPEKAVKSMLLGLALRPSDLSYCKEALRVLAKAEAWEEICAAVKQCADELRTEPRVQLFYAEALYHLKRYQETLEVLNQNGGLVVPDIRECDNSIGVLWQGAARAVTGKEQAEIPHILNFNTKNI